MAVIKLKTAKVANKLINYGKKRSVVTSGVNCHPAAAKQQFAVTRGIFGKNDGIQAHHVIQSFSPGEVTAEQANTIGVQLAEKLAPGYECVVYTHIDKAHIHNHIVINSVEFENGKKFHLHGQDGIDKTRAISDELCKSHGLSVIEKETAKERHTMPEQGLRLRGEKPWKDTIREAVQHELANSTDYDNFKQNMQDNHGITVNERGQTVTYRMEGMGRAVRGRKLGMDYELNTISNIEAVIKQQLAELERVNKAGRKAVKAHNIITNEIQQLEVVKENVKMEIENVFENGLHFRLVQAIALVQNQKILDEKLDLIDCYNEEIELQELELEILKIETADVKTELSGLNTQVDGLNLELKGANEQKKVTQLRIDALETELAEKMANKTEFEKEYDSLEKNLVDAKTEFAELNTQVDGVILKLEGLNEQQKAAQAANDALETETAEKMANMDEFKKEYGVLKKNLADDRTKLAKYQSFLTEIGEKLADPQKAAEKLDQLDGKIQRLDKFTTSLMLNPPPEVRLIKQWNRDSREIPAEFDRIRAGIKTVEANIEDINDQAVKKLLQEKIEKEAKLTEKIAPEKDQPIQRVKKYTAPVLAEIETAKIVIENKIAEVTSPIDLPAPETLTTHHEVIENIQTAIAEFETDIVKDEAIDPQLQESTDDEEYEYDPWELDR